MAETVVPTITRRRQAHFIRVIRDYAPVYGSARYCAEIANAVGPEWEWIEEYLRHNPEVFQLEGLHPSKASHRIAERRARARVLAGEAHDLTQAGRFDEARELIWQASILAPDLFDWDQIWIQFDTLASA